MSETYDDLITRLFTTYASLGHDLSTVEEIKSCLGLWRLSSDICANLICVNPEVDPNLVLSMMVQSLVLKPDFSTEERRSFVAGMCNQAVTEELSSDEVDARLSCYSERFGYDFNIVKAGYVSASQSSSVLQKK